MNAQRCAVLEFRAGAGISQSDVDGISAIFITYFRPSGYTMVERTQIDRVIDEQGFQRSRLTESNAVRIGKILNVSKIVLGDVNVVMGQYNVDVRVINVESGTIAATDGASFNGSSYRQTMQSLAQRLAGKIAITPGQTVSATPTAKKRSNVETIYGYLKVFPNELGEFNSAPTNVIQRINSQAQYGYNNWRIPTSEELSLLRANGYLSNGRYMSSDGNSSGNVLLVTDGKDYASVRAEEQRRQQEEQQRQTIERNRQQEEQRKAQLAAQGWVDLGLPSGTLWKNKNESGYYNYYTATQRYGSHLPTKNQFNELKNNCSWTWNGSGYNITGPNGKSMTLSADGYRGPYGNGEIMEKGQKGFFWSSSRSDMGDVLEFSISRVLIGLAGTGYLSDSYGSVRLVKKL